MNRIRIGFRREGKRGIFRALENQVRCCIHLIMPCPQSRCGHRHRKTHGICPKSRKHRPRRGWRQLGIPTRRLDGRPSNCVRPASECCFHRSRNALHGFRSPPAEPTLFNVFSRANAVCDLQWMGCFHRMENPAELPRSCHFQPHFVGPLAFADLTAMARHPATAGTSLALNRPPAFVVFNVPAPASNTAFCTASA